MEDIKIKLRAFAKERDWLEYHTKENLAKSIVIEASELLLNYQWDSVEKDVLNVKEELADIMIYSIMLADKYGFDIKEMIEEKIVKNAIKYPPLKSK
jgi:NTP pyrophosphatase (non-canonical NTP hydrolase)